MLLGAVGQLQFEVVQHRLEHEYDCDVRLEGCPYTGARWITADTPAELKAFTDAYPQRLALDAANPLPFLCTSPSDVCGARGCFPQTPPPPPRAHAGGFFPNPNRPPPRAGAGPPKPASRWLARTP